MPVMESFLDLHLEVADSGFKFTVLPTENNKLDLNIHVATLYLTERK